ncbi:MAG: DUF2490 domain-containing protein [Candidatus Euphemobacter frigidus]|nr:DUF2490 domain-containing protein [Candidatus Euphemobacter frigidus]MDP8276669.1 DUF2490 domain-containing protein [Candidatus Euphemobacter frigidus]
MSDARADEDWEYWMKYSFNARVNEKVALFIKPQFRWRDDFNEFYFHRTWAGATLKVLKWLDVAPQYSYKTSKHSGNHWPPENFLALDLIPKIALFDLKVSDRNRVMYGLDDYVWTYRNRIKIARPFKKALWGHGLTPFIADEGFYNDKAHEFYENRAEFGFGTKIIKNIELELSYIFRSKEKKDKWIKSHILCSLLKFKF